MPTAIIAVIGLALQVKGQADQRKAAKKAARNQKKAEQAEQRRNDLKVARERRKVASAARAARANVEQAAANSGAIGSSAPIGGSGAIASKGQAEQGFLQGTNDLAKESSIFRQRVVDASLDGQKGQAISAIGSTIFSNAGRISSAGGSIFGGDTGSIQGHSLGSQ